MFFFVVNCDTKAAGACRPMSSDHKMTNASYCLKKSQALAPGGVFFNGAKAWLVFPKQTIQRIQPRERGPST